MSKIDKCDIASDVAMSINILVLSDRSPRFGQRLNSYCWSKVKSLRPYPKLCFRNSGVLNTSTEFVTHGLDKDDDQPFLEFDAFVELLGLIEKAVMSISVVKVISHAVCVDLESDNWNDNFLADLGQGE